MCLERNWAKQISGQKRMGCKVARTAEEEDPRNQLGRPVAPWGLTRRHIMDRSTLQ